MAIAGPNYECLYSVVESSGRVNDSCIWNKNFLLPIFFFLGDDTFAVKSFMMKLFPQESLTGKRRVYDYRHSRAQKTSRKSLWDFS